MTINRVKKIYEQASFTFRRLGMLQAEAYFTEV